MGKRSSSSQGREWRYFQPRYYMKRPKRLVFIIMACISITWPVYDREALTGEYQEEILRLREEVILLQNTLTAENAPNGDKIIKFTKNSSK
ncbi:hypothetical protein L6164_014002 [Bauhinia variegata]|uniref:Uncharacterized protein n=1 Tax=Bauhinia variegata TaxID=167791 RepID=A0ACB9NG58_BAUVA|nr:hypothetical protein L6164_014002 [Bauhinia variegata]